MNRFLMAAVMGVVFGVGCDVAISAVPLLRVNQVGYVVGMPKVVAVMGTEVVGGRFVVRDSAGKEVVSGEVTGEGEKWNEKYGHCYAVDVSGVEVAGVYTISVGAAEGTFRVGEGGKIYAGVVENAVKFFGIQHSQHESDGEATVFESPKLKGETLIGKLTPMEGAGKVDVSKGWYDAGDYLEFVETASYTEGALLMAARENLGNAGMVAEARYGLEWLLKMYNPETNVLYYQIGIGDGNEFLTGDHDRSRMPAADKAAGAKAGDPDYFLYHRPVFVAPRGEISPNLAGRLSADFAMGAQVFGKSDPAFAKRCLVAAKGVYGHAKVEGVKQLLTTSPHDFYGEGSWRDDMEWGATELYIVTKDEKVLDAACGFAKQNLKVGDTLNLYETTGVAHYELAKVLGTVQVDHELAVTREELMAAMKKQLDAAVVRAGKDVFGLGVGYGGGDLTPHVIGLAMTANFYDELSGTKEFAGLEQGQLRWVLGGNPWGCSFVIGAGDVYVQHPHHELADNGGVKLWGAVVDGPGRGGPVPKGEDPYKEFTGKGARFVDYHESWECVEPAIDYAAWTPLLFSRQR